MSFKNYLFTAQLVFISIFSFSQLQLTPPPSQVDEAWITSQMDSPTYPFKTIQVKADSFFNYIDTNTNVTKVEKYYRRWEYFWRNRITSNTDTTSGANFQLAKEYYEKAQNDGYNFCNGSGNLTPWEFVGPKQMEYAYMGRVDAVSVNPNNLDDIVVGTNKSGIWRTTNGGQDWENVSDDLNLPSLGVYAIARNHHNPNILVAATGADSDASSLYRYGVLRSLDNGQTWQITNLSQNQYFNNDEIVDIVFSKLYNGNIAAVSKNKLFFSSDNGSNWTVSEFNNLDIHQNLVDVEFSPPRPDLSRKIYISTYVNQPNYSSGIHSKIIEVDYSSYTSSGATSFTEITPPNSLVNFDLDDLAMIDFSDVSNNYIYTCIKSKEYTPDPNDVDPIFINYLKYNINTSTWTFFNYHLQTPGSFGVLSCYGVNKHEFEVSNYNEDHIYVGGCVMNKSTDAGATFSKISEYKPGNMVGYSNNGSFSTHADIRAFKLFDVNNGSEKLIIGHDGGVGISNTNGNTWENINGSGLSCTQFYSFDKFTNSTNVIGGTQDNGTLKKENNSWDQKSGGDGGYTRVNSKNETTVYGIVNSKITNSFNSGNSFSNLAGGNPDSYIVNAQTKYHWYLGMKYEPYPNNPDNLLFGVTRLYKFDGDNNSWTPTNNPIFTLPTPNGFYNRISDIEIAPSSEDIIYISSIDPDWNNSLSDHFFKSSDGGGSFQDLTPNIGGAYASSHVNEIEIDPNNEDILYTAHGQFWEHPVGSNEGANRVLKSVDGGNSFTDMSNGLGPFPVNCLEIVEGADEEIYAGTDVGVFRWDKDDQTWKCMWDGMPKAIVTDIRIDYCERKLYASTYGRGIWSTDLQPINTSNVPVKEIWGSEVIESDEYLFSTGDIVVKTGSEFWVLGKIDMAEGRKIIVEQGAKLFVNGGTISNKCGKLWRGIEVWGNSNISQFTQQQGKASFFNGATIEYAEAGVQNWRDNHYNETGGVIQANSTTFRNCKRAVAFYKYENYSNGQLNLDISDFENCQFIIDDELPINQPHGFVSMWNTYGVRIVNCDFIDQRAVPNTPYGIKTIDAYTTIGGLCVNNGSSTTCNNSTFTNLEVGIDAANASTTNSIRIQNCDFTNNGIGIYISAVDFAEINKNNFTWDANLNSVFSSNNGIFMSNCSGFQIEENNFSGHPNQNGSNAIGIICNNSGNDNNEIYKNNFEGLYVGNYAINQNRNTNTIPNGIKGLEFICNTYDNDVVTNGGFTQLVSPSYSSPNNPSSGVKQAMGVASVATGNCHADDMLYAEDLSNSTINNLSYFYFGQGNPCETPIETSGNVTLITGLSNNCPTSFNDNPPLVGSANVNINMLWSDFSSNDLHFNNKLTQLNDNIDLGNTDSIINSINDLENGANREVLYNQLRSVSPYLSDTVLKRWAHYHPTYISESWVVKLILDNIDAIKSNAFLVYLENKSIPLSKRSLDQIRSSALGEFKTTRGQMELDIMKYSKLRSETMHSLLRNVQHDTIQSNFDTLRNRIIANDNALYKMNLIDSYLKAHDYTGALQEINTIDPATYPSNLQQQIIDFISLKNAIISVFQSGRSLAELYSGEIETLHSFEMNATGRAKYQARNILCFFYGVCKYDTLPNPSSGKSRNLHWASNKEMESKQKQIKVYPNPSNALIRVEWINGASEAERTIIINDINGKEVLNQTISGAISMWKWNTTNVQSGIYVIQIQENKEIIHVEKVNIIH